MERQLQPGSQPQLGSCKDHDAARRCSDSGVGRLGAARRASAAATVAAASAAAAPGGLPRSARPQVAAPAAGGGSTAAAAGGTPATARFPRGAAAERAAAAAAVLARGRTVAAGLWDAVGRLLHWVAVGRLQLGHGCLRRGDRLDGCGQGVCVAGGRAVQHLALGHEVQLMGLVGGVGGVVGALVDRKCR